MRTFGRSRGVTRVLLVAAAAGFGICGALFTAAAAKAETFFVANPNAGKTHGKSPFDLSDPKIIAEGHKQFNTTCVYCHGQGGTGGRAGPLKGAGLDESFIFTTISNGKIANGMSMPPWKYSFDKKTIWKLTAYVLSLQNESGGQSK